MRQIDDEAMTMTTSSRIWRAIANEIQKRLSLWPDKTNRNNRMYQKKLLWSQTIRMTAMLLKVRGLQPHETTTAALSAAETSILVATLT